MGLPFLLSRPSSQTSMAGCFDISRKRAEKSPSAYLRISSYWPIMKRAFWTFALLVAKWLCQNSVSFSWSGWGL